MVSFYQHLLLVIIIWKSHFHLQAITYYLLIFDNIHRKLSFSVRIVCKKFVIIIHNINSFSFGTSMPTLIDLLGFHVPHLSHELLFVRCLNGILLWHGLNGLIFEHAHARLQKNLVVLFIETQFIEIRKEKSQISIMKFFFENK